MGPSKAKLPMASDRCSLCGITDAMSCLVNVSQYRKFVSYLVSAGPGENGLECT